MPKALKTFLYDRIEMEKPLFHSSELKVQKHIRPSVNNIKIRNIATETTCLHKWASDCKCFIYRSADLKRLKGSDAVM